MNTKLKWVLITFPILLILLCPIMLIDIKQHVSPYVIAVPANEPSLLSPVSPVFSRAPYFVIYDVKNNRAKYLVNNFAGGKHEVGLHVAHLLIREQVGIVIGKNIGPEPYGQLQRRGVNIYEGLGINVQDALYRYMNNRLAKTKGPTGFSKIFTVP